MRSHVARDSLPARHDPWKGFVLGVVGSAAGLALMDAFFRGVTRLEEALQEPDSDRAESGASDGARRDGDETSEEGDETSREPDSTVLVGRALHRAITGRDPEDGQSQLLGSLVHYGYGALMGGVYGAARGARTDPDVLGGAAWGAALWLVGDEIAGPLLGLSERPDERPLREHVEELGAHLAYGAGTSAATQALFRITRSRRAGPTPHAGSSRRSRSG